MPSLNQFDNHQYMQSYIVAPVEASDDDLGSFIDPFIPTEIRRYERSVALFWYSEEVSVREVRKRIDAWEREHERLKSEKWKREYEAKWSERLKTMDLSEPKLW